MKSIEVTYDSATWNGIDFVVGEAACRIDFIDDNMATELQRLIDILPKNMTESERFTWRHLDKCIDCTEYLRRRAYINNSIKSIKIVGDDT